MSTAQLISADLSASLSFYLAQELIQAFEHLLTVNEIVILALVVVMACSGISTLLEKHDDDNGRDWLAQTRSELRSLLSTISFLSSTVVVQLSVVLVRGTQASPLARVLTVTSTLLLLRVVLASVKLRRAPALKAAQS